MPPRRQLRAEDGEEARLLHAVGIACRRTQICDRYGINYGASETYLRAPVDPVADRVLVLAFARPEDLLEFVQDFSGPGVLARRGCRMVKL